MSLILNRAFNSLFFKRCLITSSKCFTNNKVKSTELQKVKPRSTNVTISKAMKAYQERAKQEEIFFAEKVSEYEIGKRHLANIMGRDVETFTQDDIDEAIEYLLPSGLFVKSARPSMKHPEELYPKRKHAEFDDTGRPFHVLFYTGKPLYYELMQTVAVKAMQLQKSLSVYIQKQKADNVFQYTLEPKNINLESTKWITKEDFEKMIMETILDRQFTFFISSMERLAQHPLAYMEEKFIMQYRQAVTKGQISTDIPQLLYSDLGIPYMQYSSTRKQCSAEVTVYGEGSGKININGQNILYFENIQEREQVMFPLQFSKLLDKLDIVAITKGPKNSKSGQAGALRHALSMALRSFVDEPMIEKLRIAGLLTHDRRKRERKKPGRRRARARYTWKKR